MENLNHEGDELRNFHLNHSAALVAWLLWGLRKPPKPNQEPGWSSKVWWGPHEIGKVSWRGSPLWGLSTRRLLQELFGVAKTITRTQTIRDPQWLSDPRGMYRLLEYLEQHLPKPSLVEASRHVGSEGGRNHDGVVCEARWGLVGSAHSLKEYGATPQKPAEIRRLIGDAVLQLFFQFCGWQNSNLKKVMSVMSAELSSKGMISKKNSGVDP